MLNQGGVMLPSQAHLYLAPALADEEYENRSVGAFIVLKPHITNCNFRVYTHNLHQGG